MIRLIAPCALLLLLTLSCGGSTKEAESAAPAEPASDPEATSGTSQDGLGESSEEPASGPWDIPSKCHEGSSPCTPNPNWVKKLCMDVYPSVALYLFSNKSPFTHGYLSRKTKAVNASGGATSGDEWLAFDEEVVLLYRRQEDLGGMQVSGAGGGYDALRLDGSCVTLGSDEVRLDVPPAPKYAKVPWRFIGDDMQSALNNVPAVKEAYIARRKECKGAYSGSVSSKCVTRDEELNTAIIKAITGGEADLPAPIHRP